MDWLEFKFRTSEDDGTMFYVNPNRPILCYNSDSIYSIIDVKDLHKYIHSRPEKSTLIDDSKIVVVSVSFE